ncbi:FAD binding domain containing protein [Drechmeria coniospora]|uniref:FAD binding domain containing protein n=1 Tax=Drechmeria coniospora TaxID=98403 RepID=A0A151GBB2_DRECN|nr:FAD binding domain containing protein [Drechmeria coniospora]KYK54399.1 FAD binding domain containing protein [Drechmeria coniospora]
MSDSMHLLQGKTIFVAGGGIAGSAFVASLRKLWDPSWTPPTVVVFDRDSSDVAGRRDAESYSVSISGHSEAGGLVALQKIGLVDEVLAQAVSGADGTAMFKIWGPSWQERVRLEQKPLHGLPTASVRISRKRLRRILNDAVEGWEYGRIQWDSQCLSVKKLGTGELRIRIRQGDETVERDCDFLVAADGAISRLRAWFRPDDKLQYAGAVLRGGLATFDDGVPNPPGMDWGFIMSSRGISCFYSPVDEKTVVWLVGHLEREPASALHRSNAEAVVTRAAELGAHFREPFQAMVGRTDLNTVMCINAHDKEPFRHQKLDRMPVVFIGDSNHALSPFAGFGVNLALSDGWDLAWQLCQETTSLREAMAAYDDISLPRAAAMVAASRKNLQAGHATGWRYWKFMARLWAGRWSKRSKKPSND